MYDIDPMAQSKKDEFGTMDRKIAEMAKALSHPARVAILRELARRGTCICGDIVEVLPLAQSTVSQHLKELKASGLIKGDVEGAKSCYCIDWAAFREAITAFTGIFSEIETNHAKRCC
ncbi:MAG: winged helix-turn-helix transcriptional regulator [Fibrobacteres bacterium]|nr:winged helix-turn-helix transcriptional regulator [Fibrobacterota bacterium]